MGIVTVPAFGADPVTITGPTLDAKVDGLATEFNGNIDNDNIKSAAAIANSKLNLASISQNIAHSGTMTHSGTLTMTAKDISEAKGADVASATTTTIWVTDGNFIHITGTTTITSFGTAGQAGDERTLVFDGALTLTHNSTSLILPTGANITTAAGDTAIVRAETTANARVIAYLRKDGSPLVAGYTPSVSNALTGSVIAQSYAETATVITCNTAIPYDNSIPQKTEGNEVITVSHTPSNSNNILIIEASGSYGSGSSVHVTGSILQDTTNDALSAREGSYNGTNEGGIVSVIHRMVAGTTSSTTFKFNVGPSSSTAYVNGDSSGTRVYGGVSKAYIRVTEYKA